VIDLCINVICPRISLWSTKRSITLIIHTSNTNYILCKISVFAYEYQWYHCYLAHLVNYVYLNGSTQHRIAARGSLKRTNMVCGLMRWKLAFWYQLAILFRISDDLISHIYVYLFSLLIMWYNDYKYHNNPTLPPHNAIGAEESYRKTYFLGIATQLVFFLNVDLFGSHNTTNTIALLCTRRLRCCITIVMLLILCVFM
jgi:hypothetical protein